MENRLPSKNITDVAQRIAVKPKVLIADIKDMTWLLEETTEEINLSWMGLLSALRAIARSYLRGHGIRMGNYQQVKLHQKTLASLQVLIIDYATSDSVFEHVREVFKQMKPELRPEDQTGDILDQVRKFLDKGKET